jgi:pyruvate dehydrogenase E2 component (dihydrolipoamide acetyltransferase)
MAELINMPKLGFDMREGKLGEWVVKEGESVGQGETIAIIETDKASVEVPAFRAGILHKILVPAGESVPIGADRVIGEAAKDRLSADGGGQGQRRGQARLRLAGWQRRDLLHRWKADYYGFAGAPRIAVGIDITAPGSGRRAHHRAISRRICARIRPRRGAPAPR